MKIILKYSNGYKWYEHNNIRIIGYFHDEKDVFYEKEKLLNYFENTNSIEELKSKLRKANGIFSIIINIGDLVCVYSDKIRLFTLFYSINNDDFTISDSVEVINKEKKIFKLYQTGIEEYYGMGLVLGNKTLIEGIQQVRPSELLTFRKDGQFKSELLFNYKSQEFLPDNEEELFSDAKHVFEKTTERLVNSLKNRQIIIPLSGGFDSRLIAAMIKEAGIKDVLCFTYGKSTHHEVETSKFVANRLGFKWLFIDYTDKNIISLKNDPYFEDYVDYVSQYSSMFYLTEYFATKYLKENSIIDENAVFIPGHYGDVSGGSQYIKAYCDNLNVNNFYKTYLKARYSYKKINRSISKEITNHLKNIMDIQQETSLGFDIRTLFDDLDNNEKITKFNVNCAKVFTYFGYELRIPLGDDNIFKFFSKLPYRYRKYKYFYNKLLNDSYFKKYNIAIENEIASTVKKQKIQRCKNYIKQFIPHFLIPVNLEKNDWANYLGITSDMRAETKLKDPASGPEQSLNSIITQWYIMKIKEEAGLL